MSIHLAAVISIMLIVGLRQVNMLALNVEFVDLMQSTDFFITC